MNLRPEVFQTAVIGHLVFKSRPNKFLVPRSFYRVGGTLEILSRISANGENAVILKSQEDNLVGISDSYTNALNVHRKK